MRARTGEDGCFRAFDDLVPGEGVKIIRGPFAGFLALLAGYFVPSNGALRDVLCSALRTFPMRRRLRSDRHSVQVFR